jgi:hypothetical protein
MSGKSPPKSGKVRSAGASARPKDGSQLFYEEAFEKENAYRRKVGLGPSNEYVHALVSLHVPHGTTCTMCEQL